MSYMLTPAQTRAARAWLKWSQEDLAGNASVSLSTVRDFEKGLRMPVRNNLMAIRRALEQGGIMFQSSEDGLPSGICGPEKVEAG